MKCMLKNGFVLLLAALFVAADILLAAVNPVASSPLTRKNDFEKILLTNGDNRFDKAVFGNSAVISAYIEEYSDSGYVNMGVDYGTVEDIYNILSKKLAFIDEDLVLGLNYVCFIDSLDTDPTYPWHRKPFEPYLYFQRDRISPVIKGGLNNLLDNKPLLEPKYTDLRRSVYYGVMDDEKLEERINAHREMFWWMDISYCEKNLRALEKLAALCKKKGIRLRCVWMPWNGKVEPPPFVLEIYDTANAVFAENGVETLDMTNSLSVEYFHDLGHLEYYTGAPVFTQMLEDWLNT